MGEHVIRRGRIDAERVVALAALLDVEAPAGTLPPLWHWTQLLEAPAQPDLGADGHPLTGLPAPPAEGQQRMFAGGRVRTWRQLVVDEPAQRRTEVVASETKHGRTGPLTFVTVRHTWTQGTDVCVEEEGDIVYRAAGSRVPVEAGSLDLPGPEVGDLPAVQVVADETFLFRFSALTFNAHRIHYDHRWAAHEGYPGLVVHGPLQALLMGELVRRAGSGLVGRELDYRLVAPLVGVQPVTAVPSDAGLEEGVVVLDARGGVTARATLTVLPGASG